MTHFFTPSRKPHSSIFSRLALAGLVLVFSACDKQAKDAAEKPAPAPAPAAAAAPAPTAAQPPTGSGSIEQRVSYGVGHNLGKNLAMQHDVTIDHQALLAGIDDGLANKPTRYPEAEIQAAINEIRQKAMAASAAEGEKQLADGKAYLEKNRAKPGVTVTASGLQYEVLAKGTGPKPKTSDTVEVHYHGTLIDGSVFDSSIQRGQPISFPVMGVIPGWTEALQLMSVGDKWKLTIPPNLAYGAQERPGIPANSVLIFEVQLLSIK